MSFNVSNVSKLIAMTFYEAAEKTFGPTGRERMLQLTNNVRLTFQQVPPEAIVGTLIFVQPLDGTQDTPLIAALGAPRKVAAFDTLASHLNAKPTSKCTVIEICPNGDLEVLLSETNIDVALLTDDALVYRYHNETDAFYLGAELRVLPKLATGLASNFASPTLASLDDALARYAKLACPSRCYILEEVWEGDADGPRLVLRNRPEATMRRSLELYLESALRNVSVRAEHNTDETKPVDLKVVWFGSQAAALIEIKWLGHSVAKQADDNAVTKFTKYGLARAQSGAEQLADYLDREKHSDHEASLRGYLVVFDARRKGITSPSAPLTKDDALYYEQEELSLNPDPSESREDFAKPVRYFMLPRETFFKVA